jgi:hypothetical protein
VQLIAEADRNSADDPNSRRCGRLAIGTAALLAVGCNSATATDGNDYTSDYGALGATRAAAATAARPPLPRRGHHQLPGSGAWRRGGQGSCRTHRLTMSEYLKGGRQTSSLDPGHLHAPRSTPADGEDQLAELDTAGFTTAPRSATTTVG